MSSSDPTKVVVRLLPPEITEEEFRKTVSDQKWAGVRWSSFQEGKRYKGEAKPSVNSRCYLQFETATQAEDFMSEYHGRKFIDGQGETFLAVACFAPYQKAPRKSQNDAREGTIEDDSLYQEFLAGLSEKPEYDPPADPKASLRPLEPGDTPLLQYMKTRAIERKARWEKKQKKKSESWYGMETVEEHPKRTKWRCSECGTQKYLEEDPDNRGTFYCTYCWESWETEAAAPKKKKKKKAKEEVVYEEEEEEETTSRKKKKKKRDKEKEEESKSEWRAKDTSASWAEYTYEEEEAATTTKKKGRKKKKEEEAATWEEDSWRATEATGQEEWGASEWAEDTRSSRRNRSKKETKESEWWEEAPPEKSSKSSKKKKEEQWAADDSWWEDARTEEASSKSEGKWKAKAEEEGSSEKPKKGKKDKSSEGESGYWAPKSGNKSYYR